MPSIILNGHLVAEAEASVSPLNRGMMYGDGCFETMRSYSGRFFRWKAHYHRLTSGLQYLEMKPAFDAHSLKSHMLKLLDANKLTHTNAMVRLQCWRTGGRGYATESRGVNWMLQAIKIDPDANPQKLVTAQTRCIPSQALDRKYKLSNGLNYIKAAQEARAAGADDALMLTIDGYLSETTIANIFWVKGGQAYTPDVECDVLPGITRSAVLDVLKQQDIPFETGKFRLNEILEADAVFCTNSVVEIRDVRGLDDSSFGTNHPIVSEIRQGFEELKNKELQE